jgi:hypothetical protein
MHKQHDLVVILSIVLDQSLITKQNSAPQCSVFPRLATRGMLHRLHELIILYVHTNPDYSACSSTRSKDALT